MFLILVIVASISASALSIMLRISPYRGFRLVKFVFKGISNLFIVLILASILRRLLLKSFFEMAFLPIFSLSDSISALNPIFSSVSSVTFLSRSTGTVTFSSVTILFFLRVMYSAHTVASIIAIHPVGLIAIPKLSYLHLIFRLRSLNGVMSVIL